jgi:hypothetical protein
VDVSVQATRAAQGVVAPIGPGLRIEGWTSLSFTRKLTPGKGWSHRAKPQTRTRGKFEPAMEFGLYMEDYILLERYLSLAGAQQARGPFEQSFTLTATLFEIALQETIWQGVGCRIEQDNAPIETNSDEEIDVKLTLNVMDVLRDGQSAVYENTPFGQAGAIVTLTA